FGFEQSQGALCQVILDIGDAQEVLTEKADRTLTRLAATYDEIEVVEWIIEHRERLNGGDRGARITAHSLDVKAGNAVIVQAQLKLLGARRTDHAPEGAAVEREEDWGTVDLSFDGGLQTIHRHGKRGEAI